VDSLIHAGHRALSAEQRIIEFHTQPQLLEVIPRPQPASHCVPEWYHHMPCQTPNGQTLKRCIPFLEAMTAGYLIPLPADVTIEVTPKRVNVEMKGFDRPIVQFHPQDQFPGAPFPQMPVIKFANLWYIKTPPGYSTLVLPPLNRPGSPILPLSAVVETDSYYNDIAFPCMCLVPMGQRLFLPAGTPLVQVVPFRRENWSSELKTWDADAAATTHREIKANVHLYREQHWEKKSYT
jgi:hypothetical protein